MLSFPPNFLWGASTAPQQVEGQNFNSDWSVWEELPGKIKNGDSSRVACDWWSGRWREDLDRAQAMGMNAQRIGIEWARIEPRPGEWDAQAIACYREMLKGLRERGMEPFVTLHHFTSPQWVAARGGFENPEIVQWLARWADRAAREFGDLVRYWITINEPNAYANQCYLVGVWLTQKKSILAMARVMQNQLRAHAAMYHALKRVQPAARVGLAIHWRVFQPYNPKSLLDRLVTDLRDRVSHRFMLTGIQEGRFLFPFGWNQPVPEARGTQDYIAVNYYYQAFSAFDLTNPGEAFSRSVYDPDVKRLAQFFEGTGNIRPAAFHDTLVRVSQYHLPIYVTENGFYETDRDDKLRYLITHLEAVHRAIQKGADVRGYFWWSLLDNYEWSDGYTPRFGLYGFDVATQTRTRRPIVDVYEQIIRADGIPDELLERYGRENRIHAAG
ncbi:MAG TPA: family 1 glycosylhydrolase [Anaerolineae bacterium]|nr:family 1 glycosylhydrolase [Anaerolineae bacterium]